MAVHAGPVGKAVLLRDGSGAPPRNEIGFNLGAPWVSAHRTGPLVSAQARLLARPLGFAVHLPFASVKDDAI